MFYADTIIDTIQSGKHEFIKRFIHNHELAEVWTNFVQTQTNFCHAIVKTNDTMARQIMEPKGIDWLGVSLDQWAAGNLPK